MENNLGVDLIIMEICKTMEDLIKYFKERRSNLPNARVGVEVEISAKIV